MIYFVYHFKRPGMKLNQGYIGITNNWKLRKSQHYNESKNNCHKNTYLMNAINKYDDVEFTILHYGLSLNDALAIESFYRPKPRMGWNIKAGGLDGPIMSNESKQKISKALTGIKRSEATKEKVRQANLGKIQSQQTKDKRANTLSKLFKGRPKSSPKELKILKYGRMGAGNPMAKFANIYDYNTNKLIATNVNITDWCRAHTAYSAKQLSKTANPNETLKVHKGIYAIYIT